MRKIMRYFKRKTELLEHRGYYRNLSGGFVDPHCMKMISPVQLFFMTEEEFQEL